jgi:para-nitrobenzyl esterase
MHDHFGRRPTADSVATVTIVCPAGVARGLADPGDGLERFFGLPYAHPPLGPLRFAPARVLATWEGPLDATRFGAASAQVFDPREARYEDFGESGDPGGWVGDEDSLTLNIWRPTGSDGPLPVVVWIHGGANWLESSRLPIYDGAALARSGSVFVSFNYRLGVFGFVDLSPIGGPAGAHSHGLTDQLAALAWIEANIAAFGGDPHDITLMGESAGSMDIGWLLASGRLPGGVRRLVLMSGVGSVCGLGWDGAHSAHAAEEGRRRSDALLRDMGFESMAQLSAASTADILSRQASALERGDVLLGADTLFYPRYPGLAPVDPFTGAREGRGAGLDVMIGFTAYELGLWLLWDEALDRRPVDWAARHAPFLPEDVRGRLPDLYRAWYPDEPDGVRGMHLLGDVMFALPSLWLADLLADAGARVFVYRFDWPADARRRALHAADQVFLFDQQATPGGEAIIGAAATPLDAAERQALGRTMREALGAFVRTGDPATAALPWPRWSDRRAVMIFDETSRIAFDPLGERRRWWTEHVLPRALGGGA